MTEVYRGLEVGTLIATINEVRDYYEQLYANKMDNL